MNERNTKEGRTWHPSPSSGICLLLSLIILIFAALLAWLLPQNIQSVEIVGSTIYSDEQILALCNSPVGKNFASLDEEEIVESVCNVLPYVKDLSLSLSFPRRLRVTVTEEKAVYYTVSESTVHLMNSDLKVLQSFSFDDEISLENYAYLALPTIVSAEPCKPLVFENEDIFTYVHNTVRAVYESDFKGKLDIDLRGKLTIYFVYEDRVRVVLGSASELDTKLALAYKNYTEHILPAGDSRTAKIDASKLPTALYAFDVEIPALR